MVTFRTVIATLGLVVCFFGIATAQNDILRAIQIDDAKTIRTLAAQDAKVLTRPLPQMRMTPLHFAIRNGKIEAAKALLAVRAPIGNTNNQSQSALHVAMMGNSERMVDAILKQGGDINALDSNQATPLMYCVMYRRQSAEVASKLIKAGADLGRVNRNGQTALHLACYYNRPEIAGELIQAGANVNAKDNNSNTAFLAACMSCPKVVRQMLDAGADLEAVNRQKQTALHLVCQSGQHDAVAAIAEKFSDLNLIDANGHSPLLQSVFRRDEASARLLLKRGADPNIMPTSGRPVMPPLCAAASSGAIEMVKVLIDGNADVNLQGPQGNTPLHLLVVAGSQIMESKRRNPKAFANNTMRQYADAFAWLLDKKADANRKNKEGLTPLQVAVRNDFPMAVELLIDQTEDLKFAAGRGSLLHWAAANGMTKTGQRVLNDNADPNHVNQDGDTPLQLAAERGHAEMIKLLASKGADLEKRNKQGMNSLLLSATNGHGDAVQALLQLGANAQVKDDSGQSPLHLAAWAGAVVATRALAKKLGDVNVTTASGYTPIHAAAWNGHLPVVKALVAAGAKVTVKDSDGWSPLHKAAYRGHTQVVQFLLDKGADKLDENSVGMTARQLAPKENATLKGILQQ